MDHAIFTQWEMVVGLEIHVELNTRSKLFSPASNHFGDEPNTNISDVCTGQPGTLPILNQEAVRKAVLFGCAVGAHVAHYSRFDRKSYFYPDSPRNFQITQYDMPIMVGGSVTAPVGDIPKTFDIHRAHLEDDAGMLKHFNTFAGIDYNRAGVPLIEIVSQPCIFSAQEAIAYATAVKAILQYLDVSDCNMEEGSLRMDANISVRPKGAFELRNKIEIKNLNSFAFMGMALESEFKRQVRAYVTHPTQDHHEVIEQATYRWDADRKETVLMRRKESADDYRYFMEPDLPPIILEKEYIDSVISSLPELPFARQKRYVQTLGLSPDSAAILVNEKKLADYFEQGLSFCSNPKSLCNWIIMEFAGRYKESGQTVWTGGIPASHIGKLVASIDAGLITGKIAKTIADLMVKNPLKDPLEMIQENPDFQPMENTQALEAIIDQVLATHLQSVTDYLGGKERAFAFLVGQVMKATQGKASPPQVNKMLQEKIRGHRQKKD
jgi:aspartyl-tRNA(Asn)/glutamyl-tRNA(Gln) amidotransferase subunit B